MIVRKFREILITFIFLHIDLHSTKRNQISWAKNAQNSEFSLHFLVKPAKKVSWLQSNHMSTKGPSSDYYMHRKYKCNTSKIE